MRWENYHTHKYWTNVVRCDSPVAYEQYIKKTIELKQRVITSVEHGYQGNYWLLNELIEDKNKEFEERRKNGEKNVPENLVFVFGTEAYWVKDRHEKDRSKNHIIILAKNENGRRKLNLALSIANEDGMFDGVPRLDLELLLSLPRDDVFITSACLAYWKKYDDIDDITIKLHNHFGDNFLLELQSHNTEKQKKVNTHVLELCYKHGIKYIIGCDTHIIDGDIDIKKRDQILKYKGLNYPDEEGWHIDYPDYETILERFKVQNILTEEEVRIGLENTNIIATFGNYNLNRDIKLPTLYKEYSQKQKDTLFKNIINKEWLNFRERENIPKEEYPMYLNGIRYEVEEVITTGMTDYFLLHYDGLKLGVKKGGIITKRGRGSGVGFFINTLLGFSKVDRFKAPIKLYPERFLTADRILKSKSLPDIDNNVAEQLPFVEAFKELLGEHSIYPMIAFGTLKKSSAIKLYMGAEEIEATVQNEVSKQLKEYEKALKHCETEEEKEEVDINDFISEEYVKYVDLSAPYQGIVVQKSAHPCAFLLFDGDIREEIGLFRCESESTGKSVLTACIEGTMADHYKYLKTDLLIVDVVGLTEAIWERIGQPSPTNTELEKILANKEGEKTWDIYSKGLTLCVNQCESPGTRNKCMKYKMKTTAELSAFVAAIRPAFASLLNNFLNREKHTTGVEQLDKVLSDSYHYMLYQESIMAYLNWLGIDMKNTYDIIKKISKKVYDKHPEELEELRKICLNRWIEHIGNKEGFSETWQVMKDAARYGFNSAHAYCVGNDGAEIAYLKAYFPYETYEVCLNWFNNKKKKDKISLLKEEMKHFGIKESKLKFGLDNRQFTMDKKNKCINPCLSSLKGMGKNAACELYELSKNKYNDFFELLHDITTKTSVDKSMRETLIYIDYFEDFGKIKKLLKFVEYYELLIGKKQPKKDTILKKIEDRSIIEMIEKHSNPTPATFSKFDSVGCLKNIWVNLKNEDIPIKDKIIKRKEIFDYIDYLNPTLDKRCILVMGVNTKYTPTIETYSLSSGVRCKCKISKKIFKENPLVENDIIYVGNMEKKMGWTKIGEDAEGKPIFEIDKDKIDWWIKTYEKINLEDFFK